MDGDWLVACELRARRKRVCCIFSHEERGSDCKDIKWQDRKNTIPADSTRPSYIAHTKHSHHRVRADRIPKLDANERQGIF